MKIGAFAKANQTSIDTIRHYMDLNLIVPEKVGGQYDFDAICQSDYEEICKLKAIGFTLSEIQTLLLFRRIGKLTGYHRRMTYQAYFDQKRAKIADEILRLEQMARALQDEIGRMAQEAQVLPEKVTTKGVPLDYLELLGCRQCSGSYQQSDAKVHNHHIVDGELSCHCGHVLRIQNGILIGEGARLEPSEVVNTSYEETFVDDYILTTSPDYLKKLYQGLEWTKRHMDFQSFENAVCMELGTGHGFFMRHFIDAFPATTVYIAIDYDLQSLQWLKSIFDRNPPKCKVLYLCADFMTLPLKPHSIDAVFDISGSSNFAFDHPVFLLDGLETLTKQDTTLHGYYILFKNFSRHSKVAMLHRPLFTWETVKGMIGKLGYKEIDHLMTEAVDQGGPLENYFVAGEKVYTAIFHGKK